MLDMGTVVGSFRLIRKLGGGGMGTVYLGKHTLIGSKVAVKFLHEHFASNEALVQRFLAEARAVNLIGHENIINIFDMNVLPPRRHYLVMEYLEGHPLASLLGRPVAPAVAVPILTQVCDALQAAHSHGVIHRDLKPENVLLVRHDRTPYFVKVLDFGIAKLLDRGLAPAQTSLGTLLGTPEYMAPEQWSEQPVDGRTDLYALGIIAYELLTGRRPFNGESLGELLQAHLKQVPTPPHRMNPEVPEALSDVVMRAMAKRPEERFQSASELRTTLERAMGSVRPASPTLLSQPLAPTVPSPKAALSTMLTARPTPPAAPPTQASPSSTPAPKPSITPAAASAARPQEPHVSDVIARVTLEPGIAPVRVMCTDLSRAGAFLCTEGTLPLLRSRVTLTLELPGKQLPCTGEVVRHITPAQASLWGMRPGFAIQFIGQCAELREALTFLALPSKPLPDDPLADALLNMLLKRMSPDPYVLLSLPQDATFESVRQSVHNIRRNLESIAARPLSVRQIKDLTELRARIEKALSLLDNPRQRLEHDAWRSNYAGVAQCIASGLSANDIESLRTRYLRAHPGAEVRERIHASTASSWEAQGDIDRALTAYEEALSADPLNLQLQQRYWNLKRHDPRPGSATTPPPGRLQRPSGSFQAANPPRASPA
jgi:serine/threonine protein kinase